MGVALMEMLPALAQGAEIVKNKMTEDNTVNVTVTNDNPIITSVSSPPNVKVKICEPTFADRIDKYLLSMGYNYNSYDSIDLTNYIYNGKGYLQANKIKFNGSVPSGGSIDSIFSGGVRLYTSLAKMEQKQEEWYKECKIKEGLEKE